MTFIKQIKEEYTRYKEIKCGEKYIYNTDLRRKKFRDDSQDKEVYLEMETVLVFYLSYIILSPRQRTFPGRDMLVVLYICALSIYFTLFPCNSCIFIKH